MWRALCALLFSQRVCDKAMLYKAPYRTCRTKRLASSPVRKGQDPMRGGRGNRVRAFALSVLTARRMTERNSAAEGRTLVLAVLTYFSYFESGKNKMWFATSPFSPAWAMMFRSWIHSPMEMPSRCVYTRPEKKIPSC